MCFMRCERGTWVQVGHAGEPEGVGAQGHPGKVGRCHGGKCTVQGKSLPVFSGKRKESYEPGQRRKCCKDEEGWEWPRASGIMEMQWDCEVSEYELK